MKIINRIALIITPRQPMLDWIVSLGEESAPTLIELEQESSTYLVDEPEHEQPLAQLLEQLIGQHYQQIWHSELAIWDEFLDNSPGEMSLSQFNHWFNVKLSGLTFDLAVQKLMVADVDSI